MATYFKYAERNASTDVNWAEISKNLTDTLKEENRVREEKKAAIDEASRLYGETLANAPTGESKDMNEWALKFASDAQEARLLQDRLLKSGQLKLKDYTIMRQNLTDGTKTAFSLSDEYQKEYKEKMERAKSSDPATRSQALEEFYMAQAEGFANFKNTNLYINPTNYQVSVGKMYKGSDGVYKMSENPNDFFTVNELRNRMKDKFDYFDYDKSLNQWVGSLGKYSEVVDKAGGWMVITDPALRDKLDPATKKSVNELMLAMDNELKSYIFANPYNGTSLLTEDIGTIDGKAVNFTFDPAEAAKNKNLVLLKKDPNNPNGPAVPEFSDEQKDIMLNFMKTQAKVKLEHTETYQQKQIRYRQQWEAQEAKGVKQDELAVNAWSTILTAGDIAAKQAAKEQILGLQRNKDEGLVDIDFKTKNQIKLIYQTDDGVRTKIIPYDENTTLKDWQQLGTALHGVEDITKVSRLTGGGTPTMRMQGNVTLIKSPNLPTKVKKTDDPVAAYNRMVDDAFPEPIKGGKIEGILFDPTNDEDAVVASLQAQFGAYGFDFEGTGKMSDYVTVFVLDANGNRTNKKIELPVNNATGSSLSPKKLKDFIKSNTSNDAKMKAAQSGVTGTEEEGAGDALFG